VERYTLKMGIKTFLLSVSVLLFQASYGQQKLVLKPGLSMSYGLNEIKERIKTESSFHSPKPGLTLSLDGRIEYYLNDRELLDLTVKGSAVAFSFVFGADWFKYIHQTSADITQINLGYNRFFKNSKFLFKKLSQNSLSLKPKFGLGAGLAINKSLDYYLTYFQNQYLGEQTSFGSYWRLYTATPDNKISMQAFARIGFCIFKKSRELFDLVLEYNQGIQKLSTMDLKYNIEGINYHVLLASKGTNINLTLGVPITLVRWKQN
jgi:hypothetical protein